VRRRRVPPSRIDAVVVRSSAPGTGDSHAAFDSAGAPETGSASAPSRRPGGSPTRISSGPRRPGPSWSTDAPGSGRPGPSPWSRGPRTGTGATVPRGPGDPIAIEDRPRSPSLNGRGGRDAGPRRRHATPDRPLTTPDTLTCHLSRPTRGGAHHPPPGAPRAPRVPGADDAGSAPALQKKNRPSPPPNLGFTILLKIEPNW
jgi:hypothetical protein